MTLNRNTASFLLLCLIWGTTWIGIKAGLQTVPPLLFAGTRFAVAGLLILSVMARKGPLPRRSDWPRLTVVGLLLIPLSYGPLFWGMLYVDSGMAAVLVEALTPIGLLGFALLLGEERFDRRRLFAIALGVAGLLVLFGPDALAARRAEGTSLVGLLGFVAVASSAFTYAGGSVLARPLLRTYPAAQVAGLATLGGGAVLIAASLLFEPGAAAALSGRWGLAAWSGWLFLVLFGSLVGYTLYMRLLRDIGATRAGAYAFVAPVIAVLLGVLVFGETLSATDVAAMVVMLAGAFLAMAEPKQQAEARQEPPCRSAAGEKA